MQNASVERPYLLCGLGYAVLGMVLGIVMAASHNHGQLVTHAHLLLVGFLLSVLYAVIHHLWLPQARPRLAQVQFIAHQLGTVVMVAGLFLLYGQWLPAEQLHPILAVASLTVLAALLLMAVMVLQQDGHQ